jgi:hypothetical protein
MARIILDEKINEKSLARNRSACKSPLVMHSFELEFEIFCGTCGADLFNQSDTRKSSTHRKNQVTVQVCQNCVENAETPLRERIEELEQLMRTILSKSEHPNDAGALRI